MSLPDYTEAAPIRRMTVASGTLAAPIPDEALRATASAAAATVAKQCAMWLPHVPPAQPTHVDVLFAQDDDKLRCTVSVQAYARADLEEPALLACAAALMTIKPGPIEDLRIVQNVS